MTNLPPSALIRELYSAGELSREQLDLLLRLLPVRNELVHGFTSKNGLEVPALQNLAETLMTEIQATA